jgi:hypothetical protein
VRTVSAGIYRRLVLGARPYTTGCECAGLSWGAVSKQFTGVCLPVHACCACSGRHATISNMSPFKLLLITAVLGIVPISAQPQPSEVTEFRKPGDALHFEVKFNGPDADKIRSVSIDFNVTGNKPTADQTGFQRSFGGPTFTASSPRTFVVEAKIPETACSGDYRVYVNVQSDSGSFQYVSGEQFQMPLIHIRNDRTFTAPQITVTELKEH